ncbi:Predicted protein [Komagataella phaffii CBS 7435]|nr:Predicted protein [Komagataella phaffii CBS 7435]
MACTIPASYIGHNHGRFCACRLHFTGPTFGLVRLCSRHSSYRELLWSLRVVRSRVNRTLESIIVSVFLTCGVYHIE